MVDRYVDTDIYSRQIYRYWCRSKWYRYTWERLEGENDLGTKKKKKLSYIKDRKTSVLEISGTIPIVIITLKYCKDNQ